jgi:hypothetical protein
MVRGVFGLCLVLVAEEPSASGKDPRLKEVEAGSLSQPRQPCCHVAATVLTHAKRAAGTHLVTIGSSREVVGSCVTSTA